MCYCSTGFVRVHEECLDVDECQTDNGNCDEQCENKPGSYVCKLLFGVLVYRVANLDSLEYILLQYLTKILIIKN